MTNYPSHMEGFVFALIALWIVAAFLLPPVSSWPWVVVFLVPAAVLARTVPGVPWRAYLMVWLALHLAITIQDALAHPGEGSGRTAAVSTPILVVLAVAGGRPYWLPALASAGVFAVLVGLHRWFERHPRPARAVSADRGRPTTEHGPRPAGGDPTSASSFRRPGFGTTRPAGKPAHRDGGTSDGSGVGRPGTATRYSRATPDLPTATRPAVRTPAGPAVPAPVPPSPSPVFSSPAPSPQSNPHRNAMAAEPAPVLPAVLEVTPHPGTAVRVSGLARLEPARQITVNDAMAVVNGDGNRISLRMHYRVRRVEISLEKLMTGRLWGAVKALADGGDPAAFQRLVRAALEPQPTGAAAPSPVTTPHDLRVVHCRYVQVGHRNRMDIDDRVVVDLTRLPVLDLFAEDIGLVRAFAAALREPEPGPARAGFLRSALSAAGRVDDLALLAQATEPGRADTWIGHLFGMTDVTGAAVVMIGVDNRLDLDVLLHRPTVDLGVLRTKLGEMQPIVAPPRVSALPEPRLPRQAPPSSSRFDIEPPDLTGPPTPEGPSSFGFF